MNRAKKPPGAEAALGATAVGVAGSTGAAGVIAGLDAASEAEFTLSVITIAPGAVEVGGAEEAVDCSGTADWAMTGRVQAMKKHTGSNTRRAMWSEFAGTVLEKS
jgi:hypothetical protein